MADDPAGLLFAVSYGSNPLETVLTAVDRTGRVEWQRSFAGTGHPWARATGRGTVWVSRPEAGWSVLEEVDANGRTVNSVVPPSRPGEDIGTFALVPDGFCILWTAASRLLCGNGPRREPRVSRHREDGTPVWSTPIHLGDLSYPGIGEVTEGSGRQVRQKPAWTPGEVTVAYNEPLMISGSSVAASFMDRGSGLARTFLLDLRTGKISAATPWAPDGHKAIDRDRCFLIGVQGYGAFETARLTPEGRRVADWPSHGALTVGTDGATSIVEMENRLPSRSKFRRLEPDGTLTSGPDLPGYYTAPAAVDREGTTVYWRNDQLTAVDADLNVHRLAKLPGTGITSRVLILAHGMVALTLDKELHLVRTPLAPLAAGTWPCADHNIQGNPVARAV
ncbi:hypothetical protein [Actinacidiphila epipremni]|uniref:Uncharacterized protein n=1 Tax=Actinacidiphila epipremni TaxID=2053013 RepID=A0ABX0ZQG3_9ACTN|nr:hypothetical protein [Actinacidiphila epipremni]NJP44499.1 hypothetical protein [Actinacidiphila epipremni]